MSSSLILNREITTFESEKKMSSLAIRGYQNTISEQLRGSMGKDMNDVLSGKKKIKLTLWQKISFKIKRFLKMFMGNGNNDE